MSSPNPVPEPVKQRGFRPPLLGPTARLVWLVAVIATLLAAAAPMVWNVATSGVEYFVGPGAEFDAANPDNYPDGRAGYVFDLMITALFAAAFLMPLLLTGAQAVWAARAKRANSDQTGTRKT